MAFCSNCGNHLETGAEFCPRCGTQCNDLANSKQEALKIEYRGTITKCPSCGAEISGMTAFCPECGHEFSSVKISESLESFIREIKECDERIASEPKANTGWGSWSKNGRTWWIILNVFTACIPIIIKSALPLININKTPKLSANEQKKLNLITNFTVPAERRPITEALRFIQGRIIQISESSVSGNDLYWAKVWKGKASEIRDQASVVLKNDQTIDSMVDKVNLSMMSIKKKAQNKLILFVAIMLAIVIALVVIRVTGNSESTYSNSLYSSKTSNDFSDSQILSDRIVFGGWISDNYEIGDQGCSIFKKENGKTGVKIDIICKKSAEKDIQTHFESKGKVKEDYSLESGALYLNNYRASFPGVSNSEAAEIELFLTKLISMEEETENIFEIELDPSRLYYDNLYGISSLVIKAELTYGKTSGIGVFSIN